jgi:hypothetical protein
MLYAYFSIPGISIMIVSDEMMKKYKLEHETQLFSYQQNYRVRHVDCGHSFGEQDQQKINVNN